MDRPPKNLPEDVTGIMPMQGHVFEGKYRVITIIGAGGFARVYRARFEDVARDVALKVLLPQSAEPGRMYPEDLVQRFQREARAVSDLRSPNTITLHDFGRTRQGLLYMVFEFVDGTPLDRLVKRDGALPALRVVRIVRQICASLREAHAVGMLHRDIKPANVMVFDYLDQVDQVKVLDFGIAKTWTHDADGNPIVDDLTEDGTVMGTPRYMSPEQIVGQRLTPQSDIYSLGLVTYELLTGEPAAPQTQKTEVVRRHLSPEPFVLPPHIPLHPRLRGIVERMLAKASASRQQSVDALLAELNQLADAELLAGAEHIVQTQATGAPMMSNADPTVPAAVAPVHPGGYGTPIYGQPLPTAGPTGSGQQVVLPAGAKPNNTFIQVRAAPASFEVEVPMKPSKRSLIVTAATFIPFFLAFTFGGIFTWLPFGALFAWGLSLVFTTHRLRVRPQEGYELTTAVFGYERHKRGPTASIVRFEARGMDADDDTVLKLVTHEGDFTVANAFSDAENQWVASEGNAWVHQLRSAHPNPLG